MVVTFIWRWVLVSPGGKSSAVQREDRKSTRLNSSHLGISYAVFCLKKKKTKIRITSNDANKVTLIQSISSGIGRGGRSGLMNRSNKGHARRPNGTCDQKIQSTDRA